MNSAASNIPVPVFMSNKGLEGKELSQRCGHWKHTPTFPHCPAGYHPSNPVFTWLASPKSIKHCPLPIQLVKVDISLVMVQVKDSLCMLASSLFCVNLFTVLLFPVIYHKYIFPICHYLAFLTTFFNTEDFNLYVVTFYFIAFKFCIMPNSHSQDSRILVFRSGTVIGTFSCLIFDASRIYFSVRMEVWVQLNFIQNDIPLS